MKLFSDAYRGKRVLVTGHTGFKGSWLALWLQELGADVTGIGLPPETKPSHIELLDLSLRSYHQDIRDASAIAETISRLEPDVVFHLAAQPLVRRSYREPLDTWSANVMGTANVLDACRRVDRIRAIVVITTDKCYENLEWPWGYREVDHLGGHDPYSASKAAVELVAASYRSSFLGEGALLATARAGNVIGGGDWSEERLVPDMVRASSTGTALQIRSPGATRPWQHVLESLSGYLCLGQKLLAGDRSFAEPWNFGPYEEGNRAVGEVVARFADRWPGLRFEMTKAPQPHEATLLYLDSAKARARLGWRPVWNLDATVARTADWYRAWLERREVVSRQQVSEYVAAASEAGVSWAPK